LLENPKAHPALTEWIRQSPFAVTDGMDQAQSEMMEAFLKYLPLRALAGFSGGAVTEEALNELLDTLNR
jgi:beta-glucosidase